MKLWKLCKHCFIAVKVVQPKQWLNLCISMYLLNCLLRNAEGLMLRVKIPVHVCFWKFVSIKFLLWFIFFILPMIPRFRKFYVSVETIPIESSVFVCKDTLPFVSTQTFNKSINQHKQQGLNRRLEHEWSVDFCLITQQELLLLFFMRSMNVEGRHKMLVVIV